MDTKKEPSITIHKTNGKKMIFCEHTDGLYYFDTLIYPSTTHKVHSSMMLQSVAENKKIFTNRQIDAANVARDLYRKLGRPSESKFEEIITKNLIRNCPITIDDVRRAMLIYGPDAAILKGKTVRGKPIAHIPNFSAVTFRFPF
jgi:hypothetical protein